MSWWCHTLNPTSPKVSSRIANSFLEKACYDPQMCLISYCLCCGHIILRNSDFSPMIDHRITAKEQFYKRYLLLLGDPKIHGSISSITAWVQFSSFLELWCCECCFLLTCIELYYFFSIHSSVTYQVEHVRSERDLLAEVDSRCIVRLFYSFQDSDFLYLIMEYLPGGDFMTLLMREHVLSDDVSRFYIAESILAIHSIHQHHYVHR